MVTKQEQNDTKLGTRAVLLIAVVSLALVLIAWVMARGTQVPLAAQQTDQVMPGLDQGQQGYRALPEDSKQNQTSELKEQGGEINGLRNGHGAGAK